MGKKDPPRRFESRTDRRKRLLEAGMKPDAIARIEEAEARIAAAVEERRARQKEGDHRTASFDSRDWGFVPKKYITGKVQVRWWPMAHARMF